VASFISWLDHSDEDQQRVREMLKLFSTPDTVDDLGVGTIRDSISNALFPGTSVAQTRVRYFLFIPWIFRSAEERYPQAVVAKAWDMERRLIGALKAGGERDGLIGVDAGKDLRVLPSEIYWSGLVRYGIFLVPSLRIRQYGRLAVRGLVKPEDDGELDDRTPSFWQRDIPDPPRELLRFEKANFDLTRPEAEWLCERILSSDGGGDGGSSLLAAYIRELQRDPKRKRVKYVWDAELPAGAPAVMRDLVHHAERFSCAVQGAALLYNLMLAEQRVAAGLKARHRTSPGHYREQLETWAATATGVRLAKWAVAIDSFRDCLMEIGAPVPAATRNFVDDWAAVLASGTVDIGSSEPAREVVRNRELVHKRAQARFANSRRLAEWRGDAGTARLSFRWPQVQRMLGDLQAGLRRAPLGENDALA